MNSNFGEIALCLSGGGYRAASFHLGTIDMLERLDLLDNVTMLSTVSGGTILGASYAAWRIEQNDTPDFREFYEKFFSFLQNTNVIEQALTGLSQAKQDDPNEEASLIREAAKIYKKHLPFADINFGHFYAGDSPKKPFKELIFNATEFYQGNAFRFRISLKPNAVVGNNNYRLNKVKAKSLHLSDIVAASSCFPTAFEPIIFSKDFKNIKDLFKDKENISLMDGGIFDNQGIASMLLANKASKAKGADFAPNTDAIETDETTVDSENITLIIISDTNQRSDEILKPHVHFNLVESLKINVSSWLAEKTTVPIHKLANQLWSVSSWIGFGLTVFLMFYGGFLLGQIYKFTSQTQFTISNLLWLLMVYYLPFSIAVGLIFIIYSIRKGKYRLLNWIDERKEIEIKGGRFKVIEAIKYLTINDLANLAVSRIGSLVSMSANVFMKAIRGLQVKTAIIEDEFRERLAFNYIYDLNPSKNRTSIWQKDAELIPSAEMILIADKAEEVETTLWFGKLKENEIDTLKLLIVCGRITICLSLMKFLVELEGFDPKDTNNQYHKIYNQIKAEWTNYKKLSDGELTAKTIEKFYNLSLDLSGK